MSIFPDGLAGPTVHDGSSLRDPGAILLVACYELGHQPLSVAWAAAMLERSGYPPALMDVSVEPFDVEKAHRARLAVIAVPMHTALRVGVAVTERLRAINPRCHVCFMGLYASLNADYLLAHGGDSVIAGEGEAALVALVESLDRAESFPDRTASLGGGDAAAREGGVQARRAADRAPAGTPPRPHLVKLELPVPSRSRLPLLEKYAHVARNARLEVAGYTEASRGCLHRCRHCPIPPVYDGRFFVVRRDVVQADVRQQVAAGARHITFGDPDFLNGPRHAVAVAESLHAEFPQVTFDFTAKIEHLLRHRSLLPRFAELGCIFIVTAAESLSDTVLGHLDKGHTRADITTVLGCVRAAGVAFRPTWVAFTPWTTMADYLELLDFVEAEDLVDHVDPVQYSLRLLVPPGSLLADSAAMHPYLGPLVQEDFAYRWHHPDSRMDRLQESVSRLVAEAAAGGGEDAAVTFDRVRVLAASAAGRPQAPAPVAGRLHPDRPRPPHLTEPWFC
jgi:radical SAM superfamily enzyme YgiQ (UPF0313 family)